MSNKQITIASVNNAPISQTAVIQPNVQNPSDTSPKSKVKKSVAKRKITSEVTSIPMYDVQTIGEIDADILSSQATKVKVRNSEGKVINVSIVPLENSFALLNGNTLEWIGTKFSIVKKVKAANNIVYAVLRMTDGSQFRVPISYLTNAGFKNLVDYDIHVNSDYTTLMDKFFQMKLADLSVESAEQQFGFQKNANEIQFIGYNDNLLEVNNTYDSFGSYIEKLNSLIRGSFPIQYAVSATMSAAAMTLLNLMYKLDIHSYIIDLVGPSSTGKTITAKLCASMWTNPSDDSIFTPMFATKNALYKKISGRFGIPIFLDEAGMNEDSNTHEFLYSIYEQREKSRLNTDCTDKVSGTWNTIVAMTSEQRYHSKKYSQNGGLCVRIHYADNLTYTNSSEHADEIKKFSNYNYGVLGKALIDKLLNIKDELLNLYHEAREIMRSATQQVHCDFTDRMVENYSVTLLTAMLLSELGLKLDLKEIIAIMVEQNQNVSTEWNIPVNALRTISEYCVRYPASPEIRYVPIKDRVDPHISTVLTERLTKEILNDSGFKNINYIIKQIDKAGCLDRQGAGKGLKSKLNFGGQSASCYMFNLEKLKETPQTQPHHWTDNWVDINNC